MIKYLFILLLCAATTNVFAQKWGYDVLIGGGIATQKINDPDKLSTSSITTFNVGAYAKYYLPSQFLLKSGINYTAKGGVLTEDAITTTSHVHYLDIPVTATRNFTLAGLGIFYFGVGGYTGYGISGKYGYQTPNSESSNKIEFGSNKDLQRLDLGTTANIGLELDNKLVFDVRYEYGLNNLATQPLKDTGTSSIYNRILVVSLGYVFR